MEHDNAVDNTAEFCESNDTSCSYLEVRARVSEIVVPATEGDATARGLAGEAHLLSAAQLTDAAIEKCRKSDAYVWEKSNFCGNKTCLFVSV